jgi:hypothetical protein
MVDFAGSQADVSVTFLVAFAGGIFLMVVLALYFNLSRNHHEWYVDEHWGDASIDDDEWGLAVAEARRAAKRKLADLADRAVTR